MRLVFLPGAGGDGSYWRPIAERLQYDWPCSVWDWPGFAIRASEPAAESVPDLADTVLACLDGPTCLLAHSMGGVVALLAALRRPDLVRALVLTATAGGLDMPSLGAVDWRGEAQRERSDTPRLFIDDATRLEERLHLVEAPALLIWGEGDPLSPPVVGRFLESALPRARLVVLPAVGHDLKTWPVDTVVGEIRKHLRRLASRLGQR